MTEAHTWSADQALRALGTDAESGLDEEQARRLLDEQGANELVERAAKSPWRMLAGQFTETMVVILIVAAVVSALLGKLTETVAIMAIVLLFAILGFVQEYRAERAMAALKRLAVPTVRVRRRGQVREIPARELVRGDILLLEAGNVVPADVRFLQVANLRVQEAALTGESEPVGKHADPIDQPDLPLGDRRNMGYMGTIVTYGRGVGVVVATGMDTELGRIATLLQQVEGEQTPLQNKLDRVGKTLAIVGVIAAALVAGIGLLSGESAAEMFVTAVSVAVAVVPEGLPAVVTITLALGAQRMLKRNALIRKLPAVETLGSVTVICSDKTGTLTENRMTVTMLDVAGHRLDLQESMRQRMPALDAVECRPGLLGTQPPAVQLTLAGGALCNDAALRPDAQEGCFHTIGDPTEGALLVAAGQAGLIKDQLDAWLPRVAELPFDSDRKRMTTVHALQRDQALPGALQLLQRDGASHVAVTKGAVDGLLDIASSVWTDGRAEPLSSVWRERIAAANEALARDGMRVLGVAIRHLDWEGQAVDQATLEAGLTFVGMAGMIDPPRGEVRQAVATSRRAGIRPVMITGDHPLTALAIARDLQIADGEQVLTGVELNRMSDRDLEALVGDVSVYARVSPEDKLRVVGALQSRGEIVAMTGDGVNDSPALKRADIGVAMGITGTDVAKEAADMVLLDDNFATIVAAVEEGRVIYDNLLRFVKFSIGGNLAKVLVMLLAPLFGIRVALLPLQLLWLNLLTDGLMGLGLGLEPAEKGTMRRPPRAPGASLLEPESRRHILWVGVLIAALTLGIGYAYYAPGDNTWQTMMFTTLAFTQIGHALGLRAAGRTLLAHLRANPALGGVALLTVLLQLAAVYLPFLERYFQVVPLSAPSFAISVALGLLVWGAVEAEKRLYARQRSRPRLATR
ncbi:MAG: cation-translocating P-type ATPase [Anaerolineae bacterium]|jgi:Ca2+-transporting ATPase